MPAPASISSSVSDRSRFSVTSASDESQTSLPAARSRSTATGISPCQKGSRFEQTTSPSTTRATGASSAIRA